MMLRFPFGRSESLCCSNLPFLSILFHSFINSSINHVFINLSTDVVIHPSIHHPSFLSFIRF